MPSAPTPSSSLPSGSAPATAAGSTCTSGSSDFHYAGEPYAVTPALVPVRLDVSRTTGNGWALRLRFTAALEGPCMRCLEPARAGLRGRRARGLPARRRRRAQLALRRRGRGARAGAVGARRAGARAAGADRVPRGLRGAVRPVRREPERGPRPSPRGRAGSALGEARRAEVRLAAAAFAVAALSALVIAPAPSYDPWAWLLWGREIAHGTLSTEEMPAFKPLTVRGLRAARAARRSARPRRG